MPAGWEATGGGQGQRAALLLARSGVRKPREVTNVGQERFSFPATALTGVADVLISGLRICLNYLRCA